MKKIFIFVFFYFFLLYFNCYAESIPSQINLINDNSGNKLDENEKLNEILNDFKKNQNIDIYIYICSLAENSTVKIDEIVNNYKQIIPNNFLLFYIDISQGNIAIYNSDDLNLLISDSDKILMLSSIQDILSSQNTIDNKIVDSIDISLNNLSKLINIKKNNNNIISNQTLNIDELQQNSIIYIYIITMISSSLIIFIGFFLLFKKK